MNIKLQTQSAEISQVTPTAIFVDKLPIYLEAFGKASDTFSSSFGVNIFGEGGGAFFVDPGNKVSRQRASSDAPSCILEMGIAEFHAMTQGKLDANAAFSDGTLRYTGDADQLIALGALLGG